MKVLYNPGLVEENFVNDRIGRLRKEQVIRMNRIFVTILNMSLTAGYCILAVIALRLFLKRQPKLFSYLLWSVVLFRLLCPFSVSSSYSLLRMNINAITVENSVGHNGINTDGEGQDKAGYGNGGNMLQGMDAGADVQNMPERANGRTNEMTDEITNETARQMRWQKVLNIAAWIWLSGIILLICRSVAATLSLRRSLTEAVRTEDNLYESEEIDTPFVFGIIRPRIYLPAHLREDERKYVLAHEGIHIARRDYLIKMLAYAAACLHWFNPLVWLAFTLMENDMEMSCDEAVLKKMGMEIKEGYSRALLSLSTETAILQGSLLAFGEGKVKERVRNILSYRKKALFTAVLAAAALVAIGMGLSMNPAEKTDEGGVLNEAEAGTGLQQEADGAENLQSGADGMESPQSGMDGMENQQQGTDSMENQADRAESAELAAFVKSCADAFCNRDGAAIAALYIDEDTALECEGELLLEKTEDGYVYGWSSPWPFSGDFRYQITAEEGKADIWLYALVSDPHVFVWKKEIQYTETGDEYRLTGSSIEFFNSISSREEFDAAYLIGGEYKFVDFMENGFVDAILYQIENGNSALDNTVYGKPETAAAHILNLTEGTSVDEGSEYSDSTGQTTVRYMFADGSEVDIPMYAILPVVLPEYQDADEVAKAANAPEGTKIWMVDTAVWNAKAP